MNDAQEILEFLSGKVFYLATMDNDRPRVRPMGLVFEYGGRLYFGTGDNKPVYRQLCANPRFEISATSADGNSWIRLSGKAVFDDRLELEAHAFEIAPFLKDMYGAENCPGLALFYAHEAETVFEGVAKEPRKVTF